MSGHSHWATIKHKKGAADAKRGKLWSKLSRAIIIAAKHGGGDPNMNLKLRYAIDKAREVSMPKDNIDRAVKRGTGELEGQTFEELTYEGFAPSGVAVLIEVLTDNRNRTNGEIRKIFEKNGGNLGVAGCAGYLFERKGVFSIDAAAMDEDSLMAIVLEAGAEDMKKAGATYEITCDPAAFQHVKAELEKHNLKPIVAELQHVAKTPMDLDAETGQRILRLMEALDDHDDVQHVYATLNISEALVAEMSKG
ncbi:MAG: YebC/PmpR family DNA-binding transcriptional regulator [Gemmataceae bacterium]|nr:YebC/PmpR family DNA-binding transcriptional regulator [Gemmataceae bacterium]